MARMATSCQAGHQLRRLLLQIDRRRLRWERTTQWLAATWQWCAVAAGLVVLDMMWPMPAGLRLSLCLAMVAVAALGVVGPLWRNRKQSSDRRVLQEAVQIERQARLKHNPLTNALWLAPQADRGGGDLTAVLAQRCVTLAIRELQSIDGDPRIRPNRWRGQVIRVVCVIALWILMWLIQPLLVTQGLTRFFQPWKEIWSHDLTGFEVTVLPKKPTVGQSVTIVATLSGRVPEKAHLVALNDHGQTEHRWFMTRWGSNHFRHRLSSIDGPMNLRIDTVSGHSRSFRITPRSQRSSQALLQPRTPSSGQSVSIDATRTTRRIAAALRQMADNAKRLKHDADQLTHQLVDQGRDAEDRDQITRQMEQLDRRLDRFKTVGQAAGRQLHAYRRSVVDQPLDRRLTVVTNQLNQLVLPSVGSSSSQDAIGHQNPTQRAISAGEVDRPHLGMWLRQVAHAADLDQRTLGQIQTLLNQVLGMKTATTHNLVLPQKPAMAIGDHQEQTIEPKPPVEHLEAVMSGVPNTYRQAVASYFQRLAQDQVVPQRSAPGTN